MVKKLVIGGLMVASTLLIGSKTVMALGYNHHANFTIEDWKQGCNHVVGGCPYIQETDSHSCVNCNNNHNITVENNQGNSFVDQDGDGICDNHTNRVQPQNGTGHRYGHHGRHHRS